MQLMLFDDKNSWINIDNDFSIKVDYCSIKQQMKLESLLANYSKQESGSEEDISVFYEYATYFVKYHLKDWQGVTDGQKDIPFILTNDEMDNMLWKGLINNTTIFWKVFNAIHNKIKFDEIDKKK